MQLLAWLGVQRRLVRGSCLADILSSHSLILTRSSWLPPCPAFLITSGNPLTGSAQDGAWGEQAEVERGQAAPLP